MNRHRVLKEFEGRTRVRVCAFLIENESVLFIKQADLFDTRKSYFLPPGGGLQFQEKLETAVQREFLEETGLNVTPVKLLYINQFVFDRLHAIEFYFLVERADQRKAVKGTDPELSETEQIIQGVFWIPINDLNNYSLVPNNLFLRFTEDYQNGFAKHPVVLF